MNDKKSPKSVEPPTPTWTVSETTSPLDYSPMITAMTSAQSAEKDAPASFIIRCRSQQTDMLVSTEGFWRGLRGKELQVDLRVNGQPATRTQWIASADGHSALFKDDTVRFLRSLPDEGQIVIRVTDWQGTPHEAAFRLNGLDIIRQKIATACKWTAGADRLAPVGR
ncbi:MAG: hypothetical protein JO134_10045 [Xanthobacteraceae bacterium]|nr:hypothetical protein [Xanthobacteraceae bacterium]